MNNIDDFFNKYFIEEFEKHEKHSQGKFYNRYKKKDYEIYDYKKKLIEPLVPYLIKIKEMNLYVRTFKDFNTSTSKYDNDLYPFDYVLKDTSIKQNFPSPAIYIENPYTFEISVPNTLIDGHIYYEINFFSETHPDKDILQNKYENMDLLVIDLYKFFAKNLYKSNKLSL